MKSGFAVFALLLVCVTASADPKSYYFERYKRTSSGLNLTWTGQQAIFEQRLNHDDPNDNRTFKQRYFVDKTFASDNSAPVLFYLCGEADCSQNDLSGAIRTHASKNKAILLALEHRFYGESQPFEKLTTENLQFLSTPNALKDAAAFQRYAQKELKFTGRWIAAGGSYAGSLAAYYRSTYPDLVVGALSSSGPVQAKENFEEYDRHVAEVAGPACLAQMKKVVAKVEAVLDDTAALEELKKKFEATVLEDKIDFVYLIADMGALAVQYGYRDRFCKLLEGDNPLEGYAQFTREIYASWGINALSMSAQAGLNENWKENLGYVGMRQWFYQSCTEYGYWQNAYHDSELSARSALINPAYHQNICKRLYGITNPVDTDKINNNLYKPLLAPSTSNIFFSNGSRDPWSLLSIKVENGNATNPSTLALTIEGASHCDDLRGPKISDSAQLKNARAVFSDLMASWIK